MNRLFGTNNSSNTSNTNIQYMYYLTLGRVRVNIRAVEN